MRKSRNPRCLTHSFIDRVLTWAEEARNNGRELRAEYLVCVAWQAYDEVCANGLMPEVA